VVHVYVAPPAGTAPEPLALKGFRKVRLLPGETVPVVLELRDDDLRTYDKGGGWSLAPGRYDIHVGASSRDLRLKAGIDLTDSGRQGDR
jgi:beta-glucosidase